MLSFGAVYSQNKDSISIEEMNNSQAIKDAYVGRIIIAGNDVTDEDIITREMYTTPNSKLDLYKLQDDIQRIYNLGLFNKVDVYPAPTDKPNVFDLMVLVEERFYILPMPQGGFKDGQFSKFWGGARVQWNNFRGRNETASLSFGIGYEPFVRVGYSVPWIGENAHFFSSTSIGYSKNYNRSNFALNDSTSNEIPSVSENFAIYNFDADYKIGKYFGKYFSLTTNLKYSIINTSQYEPGRTVSPDGKDNFLTFALSGKFDSRNATEYTMAGSYYFLEYRKFGFGRLFDFNKVKFETKKFIPIKLSDRYSVTLANRTLGVISFGGDMPYYLDEYFGYNNIIRGYKKRVLEGQNLLGVFTELRIPVIDPFYVQGKEMPAINKISMLKNLSYKFGLYATIFFDVGGVWDKTDNFFKTHFLNGFGTGLNVILPFGFVGRTDFAFRVDGKRFVPQVVFDLDASF